MRAASRPRRRVPTVVRHSRPRLVLLIALLGCLAIVGLTLGAAARTTPQSRTVTIFACVRGEQVVSWRTDHPKRCPTGSQLVVDPEFEIPDPDHSFGHRLTIVLRSWLSIPAVMVVLALVSLGWLWAGRKLAGSLRLSWILVPALLLVAATCIAGPGHWFPKEPYEGPSVVSLGTRDAITVLDLVGFTVAALSLALAIHLVSDLLRHRPLDSYAEVTGGSPSRHS